MPGLPFLAEGRRLDALRVCGVYGIFTLWGIWLGDRDAAMGRNTGMVALAGENIAESKKGAARPPGNSLPFLFQSIRYQPQIPLRIKVVVNHVRITGQDAPKLMSAHI